MINNIKRGIFKIKDIYISPIVIILMIIIVIVGLMFITHTTIQREREKICIKYKLNKQYQNKILFNAWVKLTGNPKRLTKDEFLALLNKGILVK